MADRKSKYSKIRNIFIVLFLFGLAIPLIRMLFEKFEGEMPVFRLDQAVHSIGKSYTLKGLAFDNKSGIRRVWIAVLQQSKESVLVDKMFPARGFLRGGAVREQPVSCEIRVDALGLVDGEALLRTAVWDYSWRGWWNGNRTYSEQKILIDTKPPTIDVLTRAHNLNQGGAGLAVYKISEPGTVNGVQVADRFFPGYSGYFKDPALYIAFFAMSFDKGPESELCLKATDAAGNTGRAGFVYHINQKKFKQDAIAISDAFIKHQIPKFEYAFKENPSASLIDKFLVVNQVLRKESNTILKNACKRSEARQYWKGRFLRLPGSARRAGFADQRKYLHNGKTVDRQVHLGIDLAATAHSPVPAANTGRVAFANHMGIYGKAVLLDHGFGLFSMYGHLNRIGVSKGQVVSKGDIIGFTGTTGLAAGDHLHYAVIVSHTFVNPIEWWDPNWIRHNVTDKLKEVGPEGKNEAL